MVVGFEALDVNLEGCTGAEVSPCCRSLIKGNLSATRTFDILCHHNTKASTTLFRRYPLAITNMESATRDLLVDLERHRLRLEENVAKLRKSLQHWQTWELEYEGLKEEIQRLKGQPTTEDIVIALVFAIGPTVLLT